MNKFIERIKQRYSKKSKWSIFLDIIFYVFIILLIIPGTRTGVVSMLKRATLTAPLILSKPSNTEISDSDFRWPLKTLEGEPFFLEEVRGKVIFLNFWATWCPPCIAEMPSIQRLYDEYGDKISFVLVSGEDPETIKKFMIKNQYTFPIYMQSFKAPDIFESSSIPTSFIISPEGEIVMKKKGAAKWDGKKIKRLLKDQMR
ncbi:MAG: TlpA disulfide reductase family protein [Bacteroidales bacterium]|nr:TlpA disulfide reductase family protein [Bacteroidales bacterium]